MVYFVWLSYAAGATTTIQISFSGVIDCSSWIVGSHYLL